MGLKVVEKSRMELAEELRKGQLIILQSGMLMDRAIDAVMQNLKKMSEKVA
jgi:UDP-N-acetyl-D-mannosaminuronate dehydrogenase